VILNGVKSRARAPYSPSPIAHRGPPAFQGVEPYAIASVTLDVASMSIADVVNCPVEALKVGMKVKPYWPSPSPTASTS